MKTCSALVCLALLGLLCHAEGAHPISKVIKMLEGLKAKSIEEGKQEAASYDKFKYWCSTSIDELNDAISDEKEKIAELEDLIEGKNKEEETLNEEIKTLEEELAHRDAVAVDAKNIRKEEENLYAQTLANVKGTISAVDNALKAMSSSESATEPGMLLAQRQVARALSLISLSTSASLTQISQLSAFAAPKKRPDQLAEGDLGAHVDKYDFKSEKVIELLKGLKTQFNDEKLAITKAETNAVNAYNLATRARDNAIKAANKSKSKKTDTRSKVRKTIADAEKSLSSEKDDKKVDSKSLADTKEQCATKKGEWEARSEVRTQEIAAMDAAMKILAKATGVRTEAPGNPVPPPSPTAFLQIMSDSNPKKMSAVALLRDVAQQTHSRALERLAVEVAAHLHGPFNQVNNMIEKMIFRLMDEQKQEDEHKHWCDQELEKTNVMKDDKEDKVKDLKAAIKVETSAVSKLTTEIKAATQMIADIVSFKKEATETRATGKKENKLALKDSETAQKALADAIAVLTDFYKDSGEIKKEPWEFIQKPATLPKNPETWGSPYTGASDPDKQPGGIISVLETVMSDFAEMMSKTKSQEAVDQKEYDQSMSDNDIEMARRQQENDMKTSEKKRRTDEIALLQSQKKDTSAELEKTNQYLQDLKPACVSTDKGATYDDRKAARTKEIVALKKAQVTLQDAFNEKDKASSFLQIHRA